MEEGLPQPPIRPIEETPAPPVEAGSIPPFEPLVEQAQAIQPAAEIPAPGPVSPAERERAAARAAAACNQGRLTLGAYSDLVEIFQGTQERADFDQALQELRGAETTAIVPGATRTTSSLLAVLSGHDQQGAMRLGPGLQVAAVMGGVDLDLREATLSAAVTTIRTFAFWGGIEIRIPPGIHVETTSIPILAGNEVSLKGPAPRPDAPVLRFEMLSIMAGVHIKDHGGMKDLIRQRSTLAAAGMSEARLRLMDSRHEAHLAAREARRAAHRAARDARHHRHP
jgi:hypothetical protein